MKDKAMNRFFALMIVVCAALSSGNAWAGPITEGQARNIAANFMASHAIPATNLRMAHKAPKLNAPATNANAAYYAFNASHGGFVIVAGDDRVPAVLGYSDKSAFDPQDIPEAMQAMLEGYAAQIDALDHGAKAEPHFVNCNAIPPLFGGNNISIFINFNQSEYELRFVFITNCCRFRVRLFPNIINVIATPIPRSAYA